MTATTIEYGDDVVLEVRVSNRQYHVEANGDREDPWPYPADALTTGEENWFGVLCGTAQGPVNLRVQLLREKPADQLDERWEMVGERSISVDGKHLQIIEIAAPAPFHTLKTGAGEYRARISVAHRWEARQAGNVTKPLEEHFLQIWPADDLSDPVVLRGPDTYAINYQ
ncbi:hypothetical protein FPZ12_007970 [Amycolatopsis acidicola]|uniref:Uncharacterized protein n=1 Tax=Amycolatopsis acidicola TaxID=2596893 RepID=A0A5N0VFQ9_9PSEU|nr:hypothetical protein [Amycolatopsis acidicola]KAA9163960.1 hypothetical protein FPZ12_007970 [Amycolatopsis acidicola]